VRGSIADYCQVASDHLAWGGLFACVFPMHPEDQLRRAEAGAKAAGLTILRRRALVLREGEPPLLSLFAMVRSEHLPEEWRDKTWVEPPLTIRTAQGAIHPEYSAVKLGFGFPP
jgi:tRNA1Val (adenine37-N6)-methyltransferase